VEKRGLALGVWRRSCELGLRPSGDHCAALITRRINEWLSLETRRWIVSLVGLRNCVYMLFGWSRVGGAVRRAEGLHKGRFTFWRDDVVRCGGFGHIRVVCLYAGVRASGRLVE
jgi:hypothetical protein